MLKQRCWGARLTDSAAEHLVHRRGDVEEPEVHKRGSHEIAQGRQNKEELFPSAARAQQDRSGGQRQGAAAGRGAGRGAGRWGRARGQGAGEEGRWAGGLDGAREEGG